MWCKNSFRCELEITPDIHTTVSRSGMVGTPTSNTELTVINHTSPSSSSYSMKSYNRYQIIDPSHHQRLVIKQGNIYSNFCRLNWPSHQLLPHTQQNESYYYTQDWYIYFYRGSEMSIRNHQMTFLYYHLLLIKWMDDSRLLWYWMLVLIRNRLPLPWLMYTCLYWRACKSENTQYYITMSSLRSKDKGLSCQFAAHGSVTLDTADFKLDFHTLSSYTCANKNVYYNLTYR